MFYFPLMGLSPIAPPPFENLEIKKPAFFGRFHYWLAAAQVTTYRLLGQRPLNCCKSIVYHKKNVKF
jgi:hypothetical protein